jgi:nucleoside-diphosphate-sugar epimerase
MERNNGADGAIGKTALVLGASGGIGGEIARQLRGAGWRVRALKRDLATGAATQDGLEWHQGDAMNGDDVRRCAVGCDVIVHAVNPPGYQRWAELVLPMLDNTIAAARMSGATIVLPGTVYNFGPDAFPVLHEDSPQRPLTRKGAIRVEMERRLRAASLEGVQSIVVRAGDFFGPRAGNNWFSQGLIKPGAPVRAISQPGLAGVGHQWSYLPDVAQTMLQLIERRATLAPFADFHMRGHFDADGSQMAEAIQRVVRADSGHTPTVRRFPWALLMLAAPFVTFIREMREMRYLWRQPIRMDNAKLVATLGAEPHTPLDDAVRSSLIGLGCLSGPPAAAPAAYRPAGTAAR